MNSIKYSLRKDFATLYDEIRSRSKIFSLFIWRKEPCVRKFEGLERSKLLGISQTKFSIVKSFFLLTINSVMISHGKGIKPTVLAIQFGTQV